MVYEGKKREEIVKEWTSVRPFDWTKAFRTCPKCGEKVPISEQKCSQCDYEFTTWSLLGSKHLGAPAIDIPHTDSVISQISGTVDIFKSMPRNIKEKVDLEPIKERLDSLESDYRGLKDTQSKISAKAKELDTIASDTRATLDKMEAFKELPSVKEAIEAVEKLFELDYESVSSSLIVKLLGSEIETLETKLTAKIDANTNIREAYRGVLDQQRGMLNLLKWATVFVPIAVALAPTISAIVTHYLNIG